MPPPTPETEVQPRSPPPAPSNQRIAGLPSGRWGWEWLGPAPVLLSVSLVALLWVASGAVLLLFGAVLMGIALHGLGAAVADPIGLPRVLGPLLVVVVALALLIASGIMLAPDLSGQFDNLWDRIAALRADAEDWLGGFGWLRGILGMPDEPENGAARTAEIAAQAGMAVLGMVTNAILLVVLGLFLATAPATYHDGLVRLVPVRHRPRAEQVLQRLTVTLRWWLLGQLVSMSVLGMATALGLWLFAVPFWLPLALITAAFTFVPFLGPLAAGALVVAVSVSQGIETTLYVLALFLVLQNIEGLFLTPMVQQRAVRIPPAVLIGTQVVLGTLLGLPGLILAAPLAAAGLVLVNMLYVEDTLGDRPAQAG